MTSNDHRVVDAPTGAVTVLLTRPDREVGGGHDGGLLTRPGWAWAAALWMVAFGVVHLYWALGGGLLLPDGLRVPDHTVLLVVDVVAIPMCAAGAVLAASFVTAAGDRLSRRLRLTAGWATAALSLIHSTPAVVVVLGRALGVVDVTWSTEASFSYLVYEPWWFLGGLLFLAATEGYRRRSA